MPSPSQPRILILTAGFGEGHNSAARNLALGLKPHANTQVIDPCSIGAPLLNKSLQIFYRAVTTYTPHIWKRIYLSTEKQDFSKQRFSGLRNSEEWLEKQMNEHQVDGIVSTYPLYPYFCERIFKKRPRVPVFTIITDSIEINAAWRKAPSDYFLVTDTLTRDGLIKQGIPAEKLIITGFPVHPHFAQHVHLDANASVEPFRILYFPTAKKPHVRRIMRALLAAHPNVHVTAILGKNFRKLYSRARIIKDEYPGRVTIKGWSKNIPQLLLGHHLAVGKAGGATVHEAIAAQCPMLIHHLVPGQEEGNLELLKHIGAGSLADSESSLRSTVAHLLSDNASEWRQMKRKLSTHAKPDSARVTAQFILSHL